MRRVVVLLSAIGLAGLSLPALAQSADFNVTYHVERTPADQLDIDSCGEAAAQAAQQQGLRSDVQSYPGQLVTVTGGRDGDGAFIVQCIAVDDTTVSVVQGIDYSNGKGALGQFADQAFAAVKAAIR